MAKRPSKHLRPARPLSVGGFARLESGSDGEWLVQTMPADAATKEYSCPGCGRKIQTGTPHLVTWPRQAPIGATSGVDHRRHWHTACWNRRN